MVDRPAAFEKLVADVKACRKCVRMEASERVIGHSCGSLEAKIMFVGEAPGRLGADSSQIPFHGDKAGANFETLIEGVGIGRYESFITNAVLCNPKDEHGNNSTPTRQEIENCSVFLRRQIDLVDPKVVVTLGAVALRAARTVENHNLELAVVVRTCRRWFGRKLIPIYHPGQRAMVHRSFANQRADYRFIADQLHKIDKGHRKRNYAAAAPKVAAVVAQIMELRPRLTYFALHKLFFLVETAAMRKLGRRLTSAYIVRQADGPYCVDLHPAKLLKALPSLSVERHGAKIYIARSQRGLFAPASNSDSQTGLDLAELDIIRQIVERYGSLKDVDLKRRAYMTAEMRSILRSEKKEGTSRFNFPMLAPAPRETVVTPEPDWMV